MGEGLRFKPEVGGCVPGSVFVDVGGRAAGGVEDGAAKADGFAVGEGGCKCEAAAGAVEGELAGKALEVGGVEVGGDGRSAGGGESAGPVNGGFKAERAGGGGGGFSRGLAAGEVARGIEAIDADIVEGAAACEVGGVTPVVGRENEAEVGFDSLKGADDTGLEKVKRALVHGVVGAAVGDGKLHASGAAVRDHAAAVCGRGRHGLFHKNMFAGHGSACGEVCVHADGEGDVDGVNVGAVSQRVEFRVGAGVGDVVFSGEALRFERIAANEGGGAHGWRVCDAVEKVLGDAAEADDGETEGVGGWCGRSMMEEAAKIDHARSGSRQAMGWPAAR